MNKTLTGYLVIFLIIIMTIFMYISCGSFKSQLVDNKVSLTEVNSMRLVEQIEGGLFYGKELDNYYGIEDTIDNWAGNDPDVVNVRLISSDKKTVYYQMAEEKDYENIHTYDGIFMKISQGNKSGYINIVISLESIVKQVNEIRKMFAVIIGVLLLLSLAAIAVCSSRGMFTDKENVLDKKKILAVMLTSIFVMQIIFTLYSYNTLDKFYQKMAVDTGKKAETMIQSDLDKVLAMGVDYSDIYEFDEYANDIREKMPIISSISVNDQAKVKIDISESYIKKSLHKLLLNMLTALVTSLFIASEIVNYMIVSINRKVERVTGKRCYDKPAAVRAASFLIHVACYLPVSFIPAMMSKYTGGSSSDFVLGLPTMVLLFSCLVFTLIAGKWCLKFGWKKVLIGGTALLIASSLIAGFVNSAVVLVLARGIYGAAYALIYVAIREFAATSSDMEQRSKGLAQVTAGLYAGINIGAVAGAMIYDSVGYMGVFIVSALLGCISMFIIKRHLIVDETENLGQLSEESSEKAHENIFKTVVKSTDFIKLALLVIAPLAIAALFFDYFLPIYAVKASIDSADVGRAFLLNGIAFAYVVPLILRKLKSELSDRVKVAAFTIAMAGGFLIFALIGGTTGIYIASFVMGIAEGVALISQNMIMLNLPLAKQIGNGQMLSVYALIRKLSQTVGPQIFTLLMFFGDRLGMLLMGLIIIITSVIYFGLTRKEIKENV